MVGDLESDYHLRSDSKEGIIILDAMFMIDYKEIMNREDLEVISSQVMAGSGIVTIVSKNSTLGTRSFTAIVMKTNRAQDSGEDDEGENRDMKRARHAMRFYKATVSQEIQKEIEEAEKKFQQDREFVPAL